MDSKSDLVTCTRGCPPGPFGRSTCTCGSFWPVVKQVRLYSRRWDALRSGAVLGKQTRVRPALPTAPAPARTRLPQPHTDTHTSSHALASAPRPYTPPTPRSARRPSSRRARRARRQLGARRRRQDQAQGGGRRVDRLQHRARSQRQDGQGSARRAVPPPDADGRPVRRARLRVSVPRRRADAPPTRRRPRAPP
eukprot:7390303-Prymnesium_polylepis.1